MQTQYSSLYLMPAALAVGAAIGYVFGAIQCAAARRHERLQSEGKFKSGWAATPGSFRRIAYLLVALALVQLLLPMFFSPGGASQWCVAAGVGAGYGLSLYRQLRSRLN